MLGVCLTVAGWGVNLRILYGDGVMNMDVSVVLDILDLELADGDINLVGFGDGVGAADKLDEVVGVFGDDSNDVCDEVDLGDSEESSFEEIEMELMLGV